MGQSITRSAPLVFLVNAQGINSGVVTATFPSPPMGKVWTGSVVVPGASSGNVLPVTWTASIAGSWGSWYDSNSSGTIQIGAGEILTITGSNAQALGVGVAYFIGTQTDMVKAPDVWPTPAPAPPPKAPIPLTTQKTFSAVQGQPATSVVRGQTQNTTALVAVGTSLLVSAIATANPGPRWLLTFAWSNGVALGDPTVFNIGSYNIVLNAKVLNLVLPNLGPGLQVQMVGGGSGGVTTTANISIFTGLDPSTPSLQVKDGLIGSGNVAVGTPLNLSPYSGHVVVTASAASALTVPAVINCRDQTNAIVATIPLPVISGAGGFIIPPTVVCLPPYDCAVEVTSGTLTNVTVTADPAL